jgi:hypothetical protein
MSDERDKKDDPKEELKQGLTHLWRAARSVAAEVKGVAAEVKKEVDRTDLGKALDGAGRDFVRAAANVVDRIAEEVDDLTKANAKTGAPPPPPVPDDAPPAADDEFDGVKPRAREGDPAEPADPGAAARSPSPDGAPAEPGLRIAVEDEKKKPE